MGHTEDGVTFSVSFSTLPPNPNSSTILPFFSSLKAISFHLSPLSPFMSSLIYGTPQTVDTFRTRLIILFSSPPSPSVLRNVKHHGDVLPLPPDFHPASSTNVHKLHSLLLSTGVVRHRFSIFQYYLLLCFLVISWAHGFPEGNLHFPDPLGAVRPQA